MARNTNIHIEEWFKNKQLGSLFALIDEAKEQHNMRVLFLITKYAMYFLEKKREKEEVDLRPIALKVIEKITLVVADLGMSEESFNIVAPLYTSTNYMVRLYCAQNLDYRLFLLDDNPRVAHVAKLRQDVSIKVSDADLVDSVMFIKEALEMGLIEVTKIYEQAWDSKTEKVHFSGVLLEPTDQYLVIDKEALEIQDLTVLASVLDDLIQEGVLTLNEAWVKELKGNIRKREIEE